MTTYDELVATRAQRAEEVRARQLAEIEAVREAALGGLADNVQAELAREEEEAWRLEAVKRIATMIKRLADQPSVKMPHMAGNVLMESWRKKPALALAGKIGVSSKYRLPQTIIAYYLVFDLKEGYYHKLVRDEYMHERETRRGKYFYYYSNFASTSEHIYVPDLRNACPVEMRKISTDDLHLVHDALVALIGKMQRVKRRS